MEHGSDEDSTNGGNSKTDASSKSNFSSRRLSMLDSLA